MASSAHSADERRILPLLIRFQDYANSKVNKTLIVPDNKGMVTPLIEFKENDLSSLLNLWKKEKSEHLANEIISFALVEDKKNEIQHVFDFLLKLEPADLVLNKIIMSKKREFSLKENIDFNIRRLKIEPNDSITWIDQAINFLELGDREKLMECAENAVRINQDSSFVLRNASRLFNILGDNGRSIKLLKNSMYYKYDPNILSAEIAFSQLEKRQTKGTLFGEKLLNEQKYSAYQYSELAGALGTQEVLNGNFKKSEILFDQSLIDPNLNSFTQSFWYKQKPISIEQFDKFSSSNEVQTHRYFKDQKYSEALKFSEKWIEDESFSARPYKTAAYINGNLLENFTESVQIVKDLISKQEVIKGTLDNEQDLSLRNDLAYYMLKSGEIESAEELLLPIKKNLELGALNKTQFVQLATLGLLAYKKGEREAGKWMYRKTINEFKKNKEPLYMQSAFLNFFNEEINFVDDYEELSKLSKELDSIIPSNSESDIIYRKTLAVEKMNKRIQKIIGNRV